MDFIRKVDALLSGHFSIPFPEQLSDELWVEKYRQVLWFLEFESKRYSSEGSVSL